jgi:hypothetical protein
MHNRFGSGAGGVWRCQSELLIRSAVRLHDVWSANRKLSRKMGFEEVIFLTVAALSGQGRKVESLAIVTEPGFEKSKVSV